MAAGTAVWFNFWSVLDTYADSKMECVEGRTVTVHENKKLMESRPLYQEIKTQGPYSFTPSTFLTTKRRGKVPLL